MNWKEQLSLLEKAQQWDEAIAFMQQVIEDNPNDMDACIFMNYLLMNFFIEKEGFYRLNDLKVRAFIKKYFDESYAKFSKNPEYLYLTAKTAAMSEWLYGIDVEDCETMFAQAAEYDPTNLLYKEGYYFQLRDKDPKSSELIAYANMLLQENSPVEKQLKNKGSLGAYVLMLKKNWAKQVLCDAFYDEHLICNSLK